MSEQATATSVVSSDPLVVRAVLRTDVGRVRSENQDFGSVSSPQDERHAHPGGRLLIVADGMGGHRGGATASKLATETVKSQYLGSGTDDIGVALGEALTRANARIFHEAQTNFDLRGMGTTTSALAVRGTQAWFAHVGDSRIYLIRGDEIRQLTEDHSLVATMVREGLLTAKEAENHPRRNVLQRSMGVSEEVEVDVRGPFDLQANDTFILCSDGLHGLVKPEEIRDVVNGATIESAADELVKRALERGGPDNVTVIVARVEKAGDGEATVIDTDRTLFEETIREDPREAGPRSSVLSPQDSASAVPEDRGPRTEDRTSGTADSQPATEARKPLRGSAILKWALLFVVILTAAGAWLFFNQQQMFQKQNPPSSAR